MHNTTTTSKTFAASKIVEVQFDSSTMENCNPIPIAPKPVEVSDDKVAMKLEPVTENKVTVRLASLPTNIAPFRQIPVLSSSTVEPKSSPTEPIKQQQIREIQKVQYSKRVPAKLTRNSINQHYQITSSEVYHHSSIVDNLKAQLEDKNREITTLQILQAQTFYRNQQLTQELEDFKKNSDKLIKFMHENNVIDLVTKERSKKTRRKRLREARKKKPDLLTAEPQIFTHILENNLLSAPSENLHTDLLSEIDTNVVMDIFPETEVEPTSEEFISPEGEFREPNSEELTRAILNLKNRQPVL